MQLKTGQHTDCIPIITKPSNSRRLPLKNKKTFSLKYILPILHQHSSTVNNMHTNCSNFYLYGKAQALVCRRIKLRKGLQLLQFITYVTFSSKYNATELKHGYASDDFSQSVTGMTFEYLSCKHNTTAKQNRITCSLRISQSSQLNAQGNKTRIMTKKIICNRIIS